MAHTSLLTKLFLIVHKPAEIFKPSGESAKVVKSDVADIMEEEEEEEEITPKNCFRKFQGQHLDKSL